MNGHPLDEVSWLPTCPEAATGLRIATEAARGRRETVAAARARVGLEGEAPGGSASWIYFGHILSRGCLLADLHSS